MLHHSPPPLMDDALLLAVAHGFKALCAGLQITTPLTAMDDQALREIDRRALYVCLLRCLGALEKHLSGSTGLMVHFTAADGTVCHIFTDGQGIQWTCTLTGGEESGARGPEPE